MARYREKILPFTPTVLLLAVSFLVIFAPWTIGDQELSWREGYIIEQALGLEFTPLPTVTVHGEAVPNAQPLFPMFTRLITELGCPAEWSTRILNLACLGGLIVLVFAVAYRTRRQISAGACAGVMLMTALLVIDKSRVGYANWMFVLVIFSGHLLWYYYAALRGDWVRAWLIGFLACSLGFYIAGLLAVIFFLVPLIFMRRPLGIFQRLNNRGFLLGTGMLFLTVLLWYMPYYFEGVTVATVYLRSGVLSFGEYLIHLISFPLDLGLRLLPWALLAWAPYCVSFQMLDPTPMFSRFLRTLFLVDFFLLWITPLDEVYDWLILIPPLAVMTALNYELAVRRYGNFYRKLGNFCAAVLIPGAAAVLLVFFLLPEDMLTSVLDLEHSISFADGFGETVLGVTSALVLLILGLVLWRLKEKPPIWCYYLLIIWAPLMVYNTIVLPYQAQEQEARERAMLLTEVLERDGATPGTAVYKYHLDGLFTEGVYMHTPLRRINTFALLPQAGEPVVYVLAPAYPNCPERSWRSLLPQFIFSRGSKFNLWRGQWQENKQVPERKKSPLLDEIMQDPQGKGVRL